MIEIFADEKVGAANGKIYQYDFNKPVDVNNADFPKLFDTTGIVISKSGGGRSRGQHQKDIWAVR